MEWVIRVKIGDGSFGAVGWIAAIGVMLGFTLANFFAFPDRC
jgi:hypothetical protein